MIDSFGQWGAPLLSFVSALLGGGVAHVLSMYRDRRSKRRDLVTKHLIDIFQAVEGAHKAKQGLSDELKNRLENSIRDIQLFGTREQIELASQIGNGNPVPFIVNLRDSLRDELGLDPVNREIFKFEAKTR